MLFTKILKFIIKTALSTDTYDVNDINAYNITICNLRNIGPLLGSDREILHDHKSSRVFTSIMRMLPIVGDDRSVSITPHVTNYGYKIDELSKVSFSSRLDALEKMYACGIASILARDGVVDLPIYDIDVRPGYAQYGCYVRYDDSGKVAEVRYRDAIYTSDFPDHILAMAISTIVLYTTVVLHAGVCHMYYAGDLSARLRRSGMSSTYLLKIFTFRNSEINTSAMDLLLSCGGLLERLFAITHTGLLDLLKYTDSEAKRIEQLWAERGSGLQTLFYDFSRATDRFLEEFDITCEQKEMFIKLVIVSTLLHEIVGSTIGMYFLSPHILKTKILLSEFTGNTVLVESPSSYETNEVAVYFTSGATMPLLLCNELRFCFPPECRGALRRYQDELYSINDQWEDTCADLRNLETSISL